MEDSTTLNSTSRKNSLSISDYLKLCSHRWIWFLLSFVCICGLAYFYLKISEPKYERSMEILIKDEDSKGALGNMASAFSGLGLGGGNTNVYNEMIALSSPAVMYEVVERLNLEMNYLEKDGLAKTTLFGTNLPFNAILNDIHANSSAGFRADLYPNGDVKLYKFFKTLEDGSKKKYDEEVRGKIDGKAIRTPIGRIVLAKNLSYIPDTKKSKDAMTIVVSRMPLMTATELYSSKLRVDLADTDADVIDLTIKDPSVERADAILNTVMDVYNENWMADKNKVSVATSDFIGERLKIIEKELGVVDTDISKYKSDHLIPDLREAAKLNMEENAKITHEILELNNKLAMSGFVKDYVTNPANVNSVIPVNTGMGSQQLESQIASYNSILLGRNNLAQSSSDSNPLVLDYDAQLRGLREAIVKGVTAHVSALQTQIGNMKGAKALTETKLSSGPTQAKDLLSAERQQLVKQSLYLFLLQKREENELTQTFTAYNTRILTPPMGSLEPVAPKKGLIMGSSFLLSILIPALWIYFAYYLDTKIRSRKDIASMAAPFVGEIPMVARNQRVGLRKGKAGKISKKSKELENVIVAVKEGSRDAVSESFRIIRGNIDFMVKNQPTNVFLLTSFNAGSGKSFIAFNLAASFALKGKKVLIIDGDLRHGSASQFVGMPSKGLSNYLTGQDDNWQSLCREVEGHSGVDVLPIGHRPPNPSELLDNGRINTLLDEARKEYDYIFLDTPPVDVVVDTQILEKSADRTLFVIRAGLLDREAVVEIDKLYKNKRFKNMSVILNGTTSEHSRYHTYGGYGYYGN